MLASQLRDSAGFEPDFAIALRRDPPDVDCQVNRLGPRLEVVRVAYHLSGPPRPLRVLQSEPGVTAIGVTGDGLGRGDDRVSRINGPMGYDVLVTDDPAWLEPAIEFRVAVIMPNEEVPELAPAFTSSGIPLVLGANPRAGLAPSLARHEALRFDEVLTVTIGWTTRGGRRRKGEALPFPGPIGSLWAEKTTGVGWPPTGASAAFYQAPVESDYTGVVAKVSGVIDDGVVTTVVGSADDTRYLNAICLAAAAGPAARGEYQPGPQWPAVAAGAYLASALAAGIDVATFTSQGTG